MINKSVNAIPETLRDEAIFTLYRLLRTSKTEVGIYNDNTNQQKQENEKGLRDGNNLPLNPS